MDKSNNGVGFIESSHEYFNISNPNEKYISVTTLIKRYEQPFDRDFWSKYKALQGMISKSDWEVEKAKLLKSKKFDMDYYLSKYHLSKDDFDLNISLILDSWKSENKRSCERGTAIHKEIEDSLKGSNISLERFGIGGKFNYSSDITVDDGIYPEYLISYSNSKIRIAGQIDLVVKSRNEIIIIDHKSNKKIEMNSKNRMKYPLNSLPDTNFYHYSLQLSLYAWMLCQLNSDFIVKDLIINHIDHEGNKRLYHCQYLKKEVENMIHDYEKISILEERERKRCPILY